MKIIPYEDGAFDVCCMHDPNAVCCLKCGEHAAKYFIYYNIPRDKWPLWLQNKFLDITKEQLEKEIDLYKNSPQRTNSLLQKILYKINDSPFI